MSDQQPAAPSQAEANNKRRRQLTLLGGAVAVGVVAYGAWWLVFDSHYVETDDAYVGAETAQVTALSFEARQKLAKHRPETLGQAARISGITPASISLLMIHLKKGGFKGFARTTEEQGA